MKRSNETNEREFIEAQFIRFSESLNFRTVVIDIVHTREGARATNERKSIAHNSPGSRPSSASCLNPSPLSPMDSQTPSLFFISPSLSLSLFFLIFPSTVHALRSGERRKEGRKKAKRRSRTSELNPR